MKYFYPFCYFPNVFFQLAEEKIDIQKPVFTKPFPVEPKCSNTWERIFGIKNKLLKFEKEKENFVKERKLHDINIAQYKQDLRQEIVNFHLKNVNEVKEKYIEFFKKNLDLKFIDSNLKTGIGENDFRKILIEEFKDQILIDKKIIKTYISEPTQIDEDIIIYHDEEIVEIGNPDFLLIINYLQLRIVINIEIDEPYIAENGEIIHYLNPTENQNLYINEERDLRFSNNGIIVIRFSEEQAVKYPKEIISDLKLLVKEIIDFKFPYNFIEFETPKSKRWSRNEAIEYSNNNFRNTYLKEKTPSSFERGFLYKIEELYGAWNHLNSSNKLYFYEHFILTEFDVEDRNFVKYVKFNEVSKEKMTYTGFVYLKKDRLKLSFTKLNNRYLGKYNCFSIDLQIINLTDKMFEYKKNDSEIIYKMIKI